jgi:hypothetical protein
MSEETKEIIEEPEAPDRNITEEQLDEVITGIQDMCFQIKELRRDMHWLLGGQLAGAKRIADENGCNCEYYRGLNHDAWSCPFHGYITKKGKGED